MPILFLESKTLRYPIDGPQRIQLLEALQQHELTPLIRSARRHCFEQMAPSETVAQIESAMAAWMEGNAEVFIRGDVFCFKDYVLFLTFDGSNDADKPQIRAGIVYAAGTLEPFRKLDSFCHEVRETLISVVGEGTHNEPNIPHWVQGQPMVPEGFKRFIQRQEVDSPPARQMAVVT